MCVHAHTYTSSSPGESNIKLRLRIITLWYGFHVNNMGFDFSKHFLSFISQTYIIKRGEKLSSGLVMAIHNDQESIRHHGNPLLH